MENQQAVASSGSKESVRKQFFSGKKLLLFLLFLLLFSGVGTYFYVNSGSPPLTKKQKQDQVKLEKFSSEEDFKAYLQEGLTGSFSGLGFGDLRQIGAPEAFDLRPGVGLGAPSITSERRVSETTVQVKGIDEPDIVKTDGNSIFFSSNLRFITPFIEPGISIEEFAPPQPIQPSTRVIAAFPPATLEQVASVPEQGDLLLENNTLIVFASGAISGFDVAVPSSPKELWNLDLEKNIQVVTSRLFQGKVYVVTRTRVDSSRPCPIPLATGAFEVSIPCNQIYHPPQVIPTDSTYTVMIVNPLTGVVENTVSFVGSSASTVVYMSESAVYITYSYSEDVVEFMYNFYNELGQDLISGDALEKLNTLKGYDISTISKLTELQIILENYYSSLPTDERRRIENEVSNRLDTYSKEHGRELQTTGIIKVGTSDLSISANGEVPGTPLNQFSLDEYQGNLRIATTVSGGILGAGESANDVYVLDSNLNIVGKVIDLGLTERIFSARFIEDKGYIVTFRRIDPFYVIDLSNPNNPQLKGELKIPGFSSYLHPITKDKIIGVGEENSKVKISLFDVSSPENPIETSKYSLDEFYSEIQNTHHAFLLDSEHQVFFLPAGVGGYIFSYKDDNLSLVRVVSDILARRAIFINDYMYIIGDDKIVVVNESDWTDVNSLSF